MVPAPLPLPGIVPPPSVVASPASSVSILVLQMDITPIAYGGLSPAPFRATAIAMTPFVAIAVSGAFLGP